MKVNSQVDAQIKQLARRAFETGKPLTREEVTALSQQSPGVAEGEIRATFVEALGNLQRGVTANETGGKRSAELRSMLGGTGRYEGEKSASPGSTAAFRGMNLTVPSSETKPFILLAASYTSLAESASRGLLTKNDVSLALEKLPAPTDKATIDALWSPAGGPAREALTQALQQLAAAAPEAMMRSDPPRTVAGESLVWQLNKALYEGDTQGAKVPARAFLHAFPNDPLAAFARNVAGESDGK